MTLNQAKLLEEALTGYDRSLIELEGKKEQISTLAVDPTAAKEVPLPPAAFDFVMLLDISDNSLLNRMHDTMGKLDTSLFFFFLIFLSTGQSPLSVFSLTESVTISMYNCKCITKTLFQPSKELPSRAQLPPALTVSIQHCRPSLDLAENSMPTANISLNFSITWQLPWHRGAVYETGMHGGASCSYPVHLGGSPSCRSKPTSVLQTRI